MGEVEMCGFVFGLFECFVLGGGVGGGDVVCLLVG